ncbi:uncharacterized protein LOC110645787 isoform X2 [Hevea brasiliensis]|uniref:uncharacterized protein LOC110645787 isoform X2 n=1 Tax=Hevea brasiliensis TaxID=3981 RepID=UPI0025ECF93F|nr:uncharacterized protein LOC110645787 isoform X2 [Hevea brasiliensis]
MKKNRSSFPLWHLFDTHQQREAAVACMEDKSMITKASQLSPVTTKNDSLVSQVVHQEAKKPKAGGSGGAVAGGSGGGSVSAEIAKEPKPGGSGYGAVAGGSGGGLVSAEIAKEPKPGGSGGAAVAGGSGRGWVSAEIAKEPKPGGSGGAAVAGGSGRGWVSAEIAKEPKPGGSGGAAVAGGSGRGSVSAEIAKEPKPGGSGGRAVAGGSGGGSVSGEIAKELKPGGNGGAVAGGSGRGSVSAEIAKESKPGGSCGDAVAGGSGGGSVSAEIAREPKPGGSGGGGAVAGGSGGGSVSTEIAKKPKPGGSGGGGAIAGGSGGGSVSAEIIGKRKRGRPKKFDMDSETVSLPVSPPPDFTSSLSGTYEKRGRRRPYGSGRLQLLASLGDYEAETAGGSFTPHVMLVDPGEDILSKISSFAERGPLAVCILSATGAVSIATITEPSYGGIWRYRGLFEILSLSGSFTLDETSGAHRKTGVLSVSLAKPDGRVFGGTVVGPLIAYNPIQLIVASFKQNIFKELKLRQLAESAAAAGSVLGNAGTAEGEGHGTRPTSTNGSEAGNTTTFDPRNVIKSEPGNEDL